MFSNAKGQLTPKSVIGPGQISNSSEIPCTSSLPASIKRIRKQPRKRGNTVIPSITLWELSVAMETKVLNRFVPKYNTAFPQPQCCFRQNLFPNDPLVLNIFIFESVNTRTHTRTPARNISYKLTSGELKSSEYPCLSQFYCKKWR